MLVYDIICHSDVNRAVFTSVVTIVDVVSRFQFIVFFLLWGRSSPTKNSFFIFFFNPKFLISLGRALIGTKIMSGCALNLTWNHLKWPSVESCL